MLERFHYSVKDLKTGMTWKELTGPQMLMVIGDDKTKSAVMLFKFHNQNVRVVGKRFRVTRYAADQDQKAQPKSNYLANAYGAWYADFAQRWERMQQRFKGGNNGKKEDPKATKTTKAATARSGAPICYSHGVTARHGRVQGAESRTRTFSD